MYTFLPTTFTANSSHNCSTMIENQEVNVDWMLLTNLIQMFPVFPLRSFSWVQDLIQDPISLFFVVLSI